MVKKQKVFKEITAFPVRTAVANLFNQKTRTGGFKLIGFYLVLLC